MRRDLEADNLYNGIKNNRFFKLVGVGGSGKTSLAYLMMQRHQSDFNEIAYVTINNNIKEDIVEQLNKSLKLEFLDEEIRYQQFVSYLEENFMSAQPNLLILDINNETSNATKDYIKNINKLCPKTWKVLTILREDIDVSKIMEEENLNKKQDTVFLKELFLKRVGERYKGFKNFNKLFETILYNPLLAEQLGFYLSNLPELKSLDAINTILKADTFKNKNMKGYAVLTNDNRSTILNFLANLVSYDNFDQNEQKLLCHFILWQADFIDYKIIKGLLKGVFDSDDELAETLSNLSHRAVLMTKNSEESNYSYKLHGLLSDSLQMQVDFSNQKYSEYLSNIEEIINYGYYDFMPFADCIGNSLCEYDIIPDYNYKLLNRMGIKFHLTWKTDYAKRLYDKFITIVSEKAENYPNNSNYQQSLAIGYMNLALLQEGQLNDYKSAKTNYNKSIEIREYLPKDNPYYQHGLASAYNNLATLQDDYLDEHEFAETNYKNAIKIGQSLPKDNLEYQYRLSGVYYNLALLQKNNLNDYKSAEVNYKMSIEIKEQLPKDNPDYQYWLAATYGNLAVLQSEHLNDYKSAETNYKKAIEILKQLPKDPVYQDGLALAYSNLALLLQYNLNDNESAETDFKKAIDTEEPLLEVNRNLFFIKWVEYKFYLAGLYFDTGKNELTKNILREIKPWAEECLVKNPNDEKTKNVNGLIIGLWEKNRELYT